MKFINEVPKKYLYVLLGVLLSVVAVVVFLVYGSDHGDTAETGSKEDEEFDFEYGEGDKEQYLRKLIDEEEEEFAAAAESEAADMGWDVENREPDAEEDIPEEDISGGSDGVDIFDDTGLDGEYDPDLDGEEEEE